MYAVECGKCTEWMDNMIYQQIKKITEEYYSHFCGIDLSELEQGTYFVCSAARDIKLETFGCKYAIYLLEKDGLCAAAYSPKHAGFMEQLKKYSIEDIISALNQRFQLKKMKLMVFAQELITDYGGAKILSPTDYPLYESFFREAYPNSDPSGWLREYFMEKSGKGYFTGYLHDGRLLSVCDSPDMPYMEGRIQHTGIKTLEAERRKGYASRAAALAAHSLLEKGVCPQWECSADNIASIGLAKTIGYSEYGTAYILEEA